MATKTKEKITTQEINQLRLKSAIFDEFLEFVEDRGLTRLMEEVEGEKNIPLNEAKKFFS